jgi:ubiquinone/menaquinone biosynthesis C-methylase UbiE
MAARARSAREQHMAVIEPTVVAPDTAALPALVCPRCLATVEAASDGYACGACDAAYPIVAGIPDFRVRADPWIGIEEDRQKAVLLEERSRGLDFEQTVREYWRMTPDTPAHLAERFTAHVLAAALRTREWLDRVAAAAATPAGPWLDLGCGTADMMAAADERAVVGVDIALRWLVVARKRPGVRGMLVCADAASLPFADGSFAAALSLGMLEHCQDAGSVVTEAARVLRRGGAIRLRTTNRFTLLREPHVSVRGVGWVPRRWADAYVRWRSGQRYLHHRPLSARELRRTLRAAGFADVQVAAASPLPSDVRRLGGSGQRIAALYGVLARREPTRGAVAWVAPLLDARGRKP